ncbi:MAG: hypothetical protein NTX71_08450 [Candidatus Aureabacteria bacterium]|nr:hypothetical protein [Candidatus Auribacterota bacterium]
MNSAPENRIARHPAGIFRSALSLCAIVCLVFSAGCTTLNIQKIPPQDLVYPARLAPDAPLVLAIPGLVVPGLRITQDQHFGRLPEMLAAEGIPCRILAYDTPDDPVSRQAALYSPDHGLAWTRVGPAMAREFEAENERRAARGIPPVKKLVLIGYSQGGVLLSQIANRVFYTFAQEYEEAVREFGGEWAALQKDPEFLLFINVLDDNIAIRNIKTQYETLFTESPSLRRFYERAEKKLARQHEEFLRYLVDPASKYPGVKKFEGIESPYYPKRYEKIREYAAARESRSEAEKEKNRQFFITYAQYRALLNVQPYFIMAAASLFGSPQANDTINIVKWTPLIRHFIIGREYDQIKQTELGTAQHLERIEKLAQECRDKRYPISPSQALFIVGANGNSGDGMVDQPSAHLSMHTYTRMRVKDGGDGRLQLEETERATLPPLAVAPLRVMHLSEKKLWGLSGATYGAAYMVPGNPAYPYILNFIKGDWAAIERDLARDADLFKQFMVEVSFKGAKMNESDVRWEDVSDNIEVTGRYFNEESRTLVWTGYFKETGVLAELQEKTRLLNFTDMVPGVRDVFGKSGAERPHLLKNLRRHAHLINPAPFIPKSDKVLGWTGLVGEEMKAGEGSVRFTVRLPGGEKVPLTCAVHPGRISFVMIETGRETSDAGLRESS